MRSVPSVMSYSRRFRRLFVPDDDVVHVMFPIESRVPVPLGSPLRPRVCTCSRNLNWIIALVATPGMFTTGLNDVVTGLPPATAADVYPAGSSVYVRPPSRE